uniref:Glucosidase II beta subunit N-terminal domain-containing protein n=1 Tax=Gopherus agassizii TaxID=38772 RepID=A0A452GF70_9SAUR
MLLPLLLPTLSALASAVEVKRPRGVSLTNHHFYEESKPFTCLDGSSTIAFEWVNDDYCDCQDGSDEPGTSACPNGRFHCTNAGYRPQYIPSSRVNDGVCDCCDATDEYNSGFVCENTCKEMGRKEREALAQMAEVAREGFQLKQVLIEEASKGREDKQVRRSGSWGPGPCAGETSRVMGMEPPLGPGCRGGSSEQHRERVSVACLGPLMPQPHGSVSCEPTTDTVPRLSRARLALPRSCSHGEGAWPREEVGSAPSRGVGGDVGFNPGGEWIGDQDSWVQFPALLLGDLGPVAASPPRASVPCMWNRDDPCSG